MRTSTSLLRQWQCRPGQATMWELSPLKVGARKRTNRHCCEQESSVAARHLGESSQGDTREPVYSGGFLHHYSTARIP